MLFFFKTHTKFLFLRLEIFFWLSEQNESNFQLYDEKCKILLKEPEIRFAGIINKEGVLVLGGFKDGLAPYENDETKLQAFFNFVSKASIRKEFDESLGPLNYIAARRDKAVLVSFPFPISQILLLISAEPSINIETLAKKVVGIFTNVK